MKAIAIIPARLASTRLPRKALRELAGQPLVGRVYNAVRSSPLLEDVIIATDSEEILQVCGQNGWHARMTSAAHRSGTERVHEVADMKGSEVHTGDSEVHIGDDEVRTGGYEVRTGGCEVRTGGYEVYINVQGDEPLTRPEHIASLLAVMRDPAVQVGTLKTPCPREEIHNPNAVKVVTDAAGRALYFSRAAIPHDRDGAGPRYFKHLGIYAYRKAALDRFVALPESPLERSERLEQLRFLENGIAIHVAETPFDTIGVDTEEDLRRAEEILRRR